MTARYWGVNITDPEMNIDIVQTGTSAPATDIIVEVAAIATWPNRKAIIVRLEQIIRRIEDGRLNDIGIT
jgi:hypothetical protein